MALRGFMWFNYGKAGINWNDFYEHIYYSSFTRFDELLPGIAIALLKNFHREKFAKITQNGNLLLGISLTSIAVMYYLFSRLLYIDGYGFNLFITTFGYSFLAIGFALLTLSALCPNSLLHKIRIPGASNLALWSYAIYLIHKPLFKVLSTQLTDWSLDVNSTLGITSIMTLSVLAGFLLFRCVETPFMNLRSRYYPTNTPIQ
jgi:peptidoglycan/LPS O-acetylase OafA/YrhL